VFAIFTVALEQEYLTSGHRPDQGMHLSGVKREICFLFDARKGSLSDYFYVLPSPFRKILGCTVNPH
jgi:hypothetical protein